MKSIFKKSLILFISFLFVFNLVACQKVDQPIESNPISEEGYYTSKEDVSLYLITYHRLPDNYITKDEAEALGWESDKGNLWKVSDQKSIGGDRFYNREGLLTEGVYYECDIDYEGGFRNAKRIVYSDTWEIYYTEDHYDSFELIYEGD